MSMNDSCTAYLAPSGYVEQLRHELGGVVETYDRLLLAEGPARSVAWAANVWHEPRRITIESIGHGARELRAMQRNWSLYSFDHHRRATLIADKLPHVSAKPIVFPNLPPDAPLGSWTLLDRDTILAAPRCSSPFPNGEVRFVEDRESPPNRAYLKLFEALTAIGETPGPGDTCLDLGSSPGGWTWVLQKTGARVISVDKAPLDPAVASLPNVQFRQDSAFSIDPGSLGPIDWLCCDVACYPERLLKLVHKWLDACPKMICTVKFQGETDHASAARFQAIPGARLVHLGHNKHELTFLRT
jgi:23S rRNA (cytidine2498-2'-O)-methyltransferase